MATEETKDKADYVIEAINRLMEENKAQSKALDSIQQAKEKEAGLKAKHAADIVNEERRKFRK